MRLWRPKEIPELLRCHFQEVPLGNEQKKYKLTRWSSAGPNLAIKKFSIIRTKKMFHEGFKNRISQLGTLK